MDSRTHAVHALPRRHFVPNITIGAPVIKALRKHTNAYLDCHLMVSHPEQWVKDFADAGASGFTFHIEATGKNPPVFLFRWVTDNHLLRCCRVQGQKLHRS